jgi:hypothetical protein
MNVSPEAPPLAARPHPDPPTVETMSLRGVWFGLLFAAPFWVLVAAMVARAH